VTLLVGFAIIWLSLLIFSLEGFLNHRKQSAPASAL
jgi:EamA domain-containing membrane protein RarD